MTVADTTRAGAPAAALVERTVDEPPPLAERERALLEALARVVSGRIAGDRLALLNASGLT